MSIISKDWFAKGGAPILFVLGINSYLLISGLDGVFSASEPPKRRLSDSAHYLSYEFSVDQAQYWIFLVIYSSAIICSLASLAFYSRSFKNKFNNGDKKAAIFFVAAFILPFLSLLIILDLPPLNRTVD